MFTPTEIYHKILNIYRLGYSENPFILEYKVNEQRLQGDKNPINMD